MSAGIEKRVLAAAHSEDVQAFGVDGGCVGPSAQVDELSLEPLDILVQALVDGAFRTYTSTPAAATPCAPAPGPLRGAATASSRSLANRPDGTQ